MSRKALVICAISFSLFGLLAISGQPAASEPSMNAKAVLYFNQGVHLVEAKKYEEAAKAFTAATKADPSSAEAQTNLGVTLGVLKDYKQALVHLNEAIRLDPEFSTGYGQRGLCKNSLKDYVGAIADFDRALALRPGSLYVLTNRGVAKMESGDMTGARADFTAALKIAPNDPRATNNLYILESGGKSVGSNFHLEPAGSKPKSAKEFGPDNDVADSHYTAATRLMSARKYKEAIAELDQAIKVKPHVEYYLCRSAAHGFLGQHKLLLADCDKAIEMDPKNPTAYMNRCCEYVDLGDGQAALKDGDQAVFLNAEASKDQKVKRIQALYLNRGRAHYILHDLENALADFNKAIEIDASYAVAFHNRAIAYLESNESKQAVADFQMAAELYKQQGNSASATTCLQEAQQCLSGKASAVK